MLDTGLLASLGSPAKGRPAAREQALRQFRGWSPDTVISPTAHAVLLAWLARIARFSRFATDSLCRIIPWTMPSIFACWSASGVSMSSL